ncbi:Ist2p [Sugiyamaella lignohabitans]|uniref:Ist2p n=1 Tax=Sugiyamaella lignohabitans TaxID=796027 RepID=A0A167EQ86_9ASCO|nr:Ist2p [Sugiyamaella lignohabitans]ANB14336.1 Ist2p [Sugiyamaella lignohabitans]
MASAQPEARVQLPEKTGVSTAASGADAGGSEKSHIDLKGVEEIRPDYAIQISLTNSKPKDLANIEKLTSALASVGLYSQVRQGNLGKSLILVKASTKSVSERSVKSLVKDWLHEIPTPSIDSAHTDGALELSESLSPSDRLRIIYDAITNPPEDGGAGVRPHLGEWSFVDSIFALQDSALNREWLKRLSKQWIIRDSELDFIQKQFGEKIALYFGFLQFYFLWSLVPAVVGIITQNFLGAYSTVYAVINLVWGLSFVEAWKRREEQLSIRWGVKGTSAIEVRRLEFQPDSTIPDPITGELRPYYASWKRILKQVSFIPFALTFILVLVAFQSSVFVIEIFLTQIYSGPFKQFLAFVPTILLAGCTPQISAIYTFIAKKLNAFENHETEESYELAYTQKQFIFNFFVSYMGLFLTAYVYLPFGHLIIPHLDSLRQLLHFHAGQEIPITDAFELNKHRLHQQVIYFAITAQVVSFAMETVVPYVKRIVFGYITKYTTGEVIFDDAPEEAKFLSQVRTQADLPDYDVQEDYRQMVVQFGYTILFSPVWAYSPLASSINVWFQIRGDAAKICLDGRRPVPRRAETIGPWLGNLSFLTWLSSLTTASIIAMYSALSNHTDSLLTVVDEKAHHHPIVQAKPWTILAVILISEHGFFAARSLISAIVKSIPTKEGFEAGKNRYDLRKRHLKSEEIINANVVSETNPVENEWKSVSKRELSDQIEKALIPPKTLKDKKNQ